MANESVKEAELLRTVQLVEEHKGNMTEAGKVLGITRPTVAWRLKKAEAMGLIMNAEAVKQRDYDLPELPDEDLTAEQILDHLEETFEQRKKYHDAKSWMKVKIREDLPIAINWFGDPHLGSNDCDYKRIREHVNIVRETDRMYGANIGDTADNWPWSGRLLKIYADMNASKARERSLAKWFLQEAGIPWLIWLEGNHDWMDPGFVNYLRGVNGNRVPMIDWRARFKVTFPNGEEFSIDAAHDHKGHSMWNVLHGQIRASLSGAKICDLYIAGHRHNWALATHEMPDGEIVNLARCRGYKFYDSHAMHHGYDDQQQGCSIVTVLDPLTQLKTERLKTFSDTEAGADYLNYLLRKYE